MLWSIPIATGCWRLWTGGLLRESLDFLTTINSAARYYGTENHNVNGEYEKDARDAFYSHVLDIGL